MNEKRDVRAFPVIAASILHLLESASTPQTFADLFREARASEPVSCTSCGERACAVNGESETVAPVLVVNLTWMETPSSDSIAQLVRGALLPFDSAVAFGGGAEGMYQCVAVVCFRGDHYTAYARSRDDGCWRLFNDATVGVRDDDELVVDAQRETVLHRDAFGVGCGYGRG